MGLGIVFDLIDSVLIYCIDCYFATRMLPMKRPGLFWLVEGLLHIAAGGSGYLYLFVWPDAQVPLVVATIVSGTLATIVVPLLFWEDSPLRRVVALCALNFSSGIGFGLQTMLAEPLTGVPVPEAFLDELALWGAQPLAWVFGEAVGMTVTIGLLAFSVRLLRRGWGASSTTGGPLALLLMGQLVLSSFCFLAISRSVGVVWYGILTLLLVLGVAVVAAGAVAADRCEARDQARHRRLLEESRLAGYCAQQEESQKIVRSIAVLRHDMRNEVAVALRLAERGQTDRACEILQEMAARCEATPSVAGEGREA